MAKDDADIYATDNRRIPQNLMSVFNPGWFSKDDRVVWFTSYPYYRGKITQDTVKLINKILVVKFPYSRY